MKRITRKLFRIRQKHEIEFYVDAESKEMALADWDTAPRLLLVDEDGVTDLNHSGLLVERFESMYSEQVGETEIVEVDLERNPL